MSNKQKTIQGESEISGVGLHTGNKVTMRLKPAQENSGITFIRVDLPDKPKIRAVLENVFEDTEIPRCTSIRQGDAVIHTVEHIMSVLCGLEIDNLTIEVAGNEIPGLDGSGLEFFKAIKKAGVVEQKAERKWLSITEPIGVDYKGSSMYVVPCNDFRVSYTLNYDHPQLRSQFFSAVINSATFEKEIVSCRTFCLESEAEELRSSGLGKGADYDNTLVVGHKGIIKNEVKFDDEFARHKVLDFIGDFYLLGMPIRGHVFAVKSGHSLNIALLKKINEQKVKMEKRGFIAEIDWGEKKELDINAIMKILPHRYPFLLIDRVVELEQGNSAVGIKNVTINDNFFQGHFPQKPIMPGVLMVEAMAQTAGVVALTSGNHDGKVALFMSTDSVKFRRVVSPGDQLHFYVELVVDKSRTSKFKCQAKVEDNVVAEAEVSFSYMDASYLN